MHRKALSTFATNLVLHGVDLVTVKELMGHADISTTLRYAHPTPESKRNAVELLSNVVELRSETLRRRSK